MPEAAGSPAGPADALASKGSAVEEVVDLRFFRPLGMRLARRLLPTRVSPDHVTAGCLVLGLAAGWCFVPDSAAWGAAGFALFIASDLLDSADGQLARLRGTSTRFGRILDGVSDNSRFINLYFSVIARLVLHHGWTFPQAFLLGLAAGISHSYQSAAVDAVRNAYLEIAEGGKGEFELPEDTPASAPGTGVFARAAQAGYAGYVRRQARLVPAAAGLARRLRALGSTPAGEPPAAAAVRAAYARREALVVRQAAWLGQNIRFPLVALPCILGAPAVFFWLTLGPLNLVLAALLVAHEGRAARAAAGLDGVTAGGTAGGAAAYEVDRGAAGAYARG